MKKGIVKDIAAGLLLVTMLLAVGGCLLRPSLKTPAPAVAETSGALVAAYAGQHVLYLYYAAGLAVILVGVATFVFGGKATGAALIASGVGVSHFGQTLILYPLLSLVAVLAVATVSVFIAYDRWKKQKVLTATSAQLEREHSVLKILTGVVEKVPEGRAIKNGIAALGREVENRVREVVTPTKNELEEEGAM